MLTRTLWIIFLSITLMLAFTTQPKATQATSNYTLVDVCPGTGIQQRTPDFQPGGIILTYFDKTGMWVYDIDNNARYPLPDTAPCGTNCHLSRDATWVTYLNSQDNIFSKMRLDGTQRTPLARRASEVSWWQDDTLLIWTPENDAFLRLEGGTELISLNATGATNIQPGGYWALILEQQDDDFMRVLVNLETRGLEWMEERLPIGLDARYHNAADWAPDGSWMAFTAPLDLSADVLSSEIFAVQPHLAGEVVQWTDLRAAYGDVRINGHAPGELSWSPDSTRIAFWVTPLLGPDPEANTGTARLHVLDVTTGAIRVYCGFVTTEHTPNPPRLIWSPEGTHIAFGGNVPDDEQGYLLLVLDTESGEMTQLSNGIFPVFGSPDVIVWGRRP